MISFLGILFVGYIYAVKGALDRNGLEAPPHPEPPGQPGQPRLPVALRPGDRSRS